MSEPDAPELLRRAGGKQGRYDREAVVWQKRHFRSRMAVLALGVLTALAGVVRSYGMLDRPPLDLARGFLVLLPAGAALLMVAIFWVNPGQRWVAFRAGAESLKTEAFFFATGAEKYRAPAGPGRAAVFGRRLEEMDALVRSMMPPGGWERLRAYFEGWSARPAASAPHQAGCPFVPTRELDGPAYLGERLRSQRDWYQRRARQHRRTQVVLGTGVFVSNLAAGGLAWYAVYQWVPLFTTLVGALTTFASLRNAEFLANSYRQTVKQLDELESAWRAGEYDQAPAGFQQFVEQVEQVIAREYTGWVQVQPNVTR